MLYTSNIGNWVSDRWSGLLKGWAQEAADYGVHLYPAGRKTGWGSAGWYAYKHFQDATRGAAARPSGLTRWSLPIKQRQETALDALLRSQPTHLHLSGFSETRNAVFEGVNLWGCPRTVNPKSGPGGSPLRTFLDKTTNLDGCQKNKQWSVDRNQTFLADCREAVGPLLGPNCNRYGSTNLSVSYAWKSRMAPSHADEQVTALVRERARKHRVVVIYSVLPSNALKPWGLDACACPALGQPDNGCVACTDDHVSDAFTPPQRWLDRWNGEMRRLFAWLRSEIGEHACLVWKGNNIGSRFFAEDTAHHASSVGGINDQLNKAAFALAQEYGLVPVDMTPVTVKQTRSPGYFRLWEARKKAKPGSINASRDIDLHHWYDQGELWQHLVQSALEACHSARPPPIDPMVI